MDKHINIWLNQRGIENNLKSVRAAIAKTTNELAKLPYQTEEWYRKANELSKLKSIYTEMRDEIRLSGEEIEKAAERTSKMVINAGAIASAYTGASSAVRRFISATQEYVDAYASLDDAMTSVSKYTGLAREEVKQLNEEFLRRENTHYLIHDEQGDGNF